MKSYRCKVPTSAISVIQCLEEFLLLFTVKGLVRHILDGTLNYCIQRTGTMCSLKDNATSSSFASRYELLCIECLQSIVWTQTNANRDSYAGTIYGRTMNGQSLVNTRPSVAA